MNLWFMSCVLVDDSADFKAGVASLASLLQIPPHNDHHVVLKVGKVVLT